MRRTVSSLFLFLTALPACRPSPVATTAPETAAPKPAAREETPAPGTISPKAATEAAVDELLGLMRRRLDVMHDVSRWKWKSKAAIEDPKREAALLDDVAGRGRALGLDPDRTRAFFAAQIEAAKVVQRADLRRWESDPTAVPAGDAPDLAEVLRPRIDALNRDLLAALARALPALQRDADVPARLRTRAEDLLSGDGIDPEARAAAIRPLVGAAD